MTLDYDAIVTVSGDGIAHEIFNGFAQHDNPRAAFAIPLAPVPTGSGNGCSLSLLGLKVNCLSFGRETLSVSRLK
jgi:sphingosine kinase